MPPEKGKANQELIKFLSRELKVPKSFIKIISGEKSRMKEVFIRNIDSSKIEKLLNFL